MKKWYAIKKKNKKRWTAYHIEPQQIEQLKSGYEWRGPYKSIAAAMIGVDSNDKVKVQ